MFSPSPSYISFFLRFLSFFHSFISFCHSSFSPSPRRFVWENKGCSGSARLCFTLPSF